MSDRQTIFVEVFAGKGGFYWRLRSRNNQILATSEAFTRRRNAVRASNKVNGALMLGLALIADAKKHPSQTKRAARALKDRMNAGCIAKLDTAYFNNHKAKRIDVSRKFAERYQAELELFDKKTVLPANLMFFGIPLRIVRKSWRGPIERQFRFL